jgi:hypothetical protein
MPKYLVYGMYPEALTCGGGGASSCLYQQLINLCVQYLAYRTYPEALSYGGVGLVQVSISS